MADVPVLELLAEPVRRSPESAAPAPLAVARMARTYHERTSFDFCIIDWKSGILHEGPCIALLRRIPPSQLQRLKSVGSVRIFRTPDGMFLFSAPVPGDLDGRYAAVGCAVADEDRLLESWEPVVSEIGWKDEEFRDWMTRHSGFSEQAFQRILTLASDGLRQELSLRRSADEADLLANQVNTLLGEITFLHDLTGQLRLSVSPQDLARRGIQQLCRTIGAEGCGIWLEDGTPEPIWLTAGRRHVDQEILPALLAEFDRYDWARPLVRNARDGQPICATLPEIRNLVVAPLRSTCRMGGWLFAVNATNNGNFGTVEASLAASVATVIATHLQNVSLFRENDQLNLAFVQSLVSTIDAKDAYTRGHSIRVAAVARFLTERLGLGSEQQETIHLSGLLHDIGKIGVDDAILRKPGRLTDAEFEQVRQHPVIGCQILSGLSKLEHVLPGVRHHHESYDGSGYPDGLAGERIPRMARIMAVADAFDAMRSDRPYRVGLTADQVARILEEGAGRQWDPVVIRAFTASRSDVERVWRTALDTVPSPAAIDANHRG